MRLVSVTGFEVSEIPLALWEFSEKRINLKELLPDSRIDPVTYSAVSLEGDEVVCCMDAESSI